MCAAGENLDVCKNCTDVAFVAWAVARIKKRLSSNLTLIIVPSKSSLNYTELLQLNARTALVLDNLS